MKLAELLNLTRVELDDVVEPFLWADDELMEYANDAQQEACRRGRLIVDSTTSAICSITLVANTASYDLDPRVIRINRIRLTGDTYPLRPMMVRDLDAQAPGWEDWSEAPTIWVPDWQTGKVRFVGNPKAAGTANLTVVRLPLADMNDPDDSIEIRAEYQRSLRHWIAFRAWSKRDSETFNAKSAAGALALFEQEFGRKQGAYDEQWMTQYYTGSEDGRY